MRVVSIFLARNQNVNFFLYSSINKIELTAAEYYGVIKLMTQNTFLHMMLHRVPVVTVLGERSEGLRGKVTPRSRQDLLPFDGKKEEVLRFTTSRNTPGGSF